MLSGLLVGCDQEPKTSILNRSASITPCAPIHFIVPNDFHGRIEITEDGVIGNDPATNNGTLVITVPSSGKVQLRNWEFLFCEHHETASYASGIPIADPNMTKVGQVFPPNKIGFYALGTEVSSSHPKETAVWFIGTKNDLDHLK